MTMLSVSMKRDPEDRWIATDDQAAIREKMLDKTLADSYPASDPPSTLPNPSVDSLYVSNSHPSSVDHGP